ncbi:MAG: hypothetical protein RMN51_03305 [Verrucomicrobiota bacterium]|nr:hypothetical protein [Limisphaera sp.]MDW8381126.1 hypothetical protein [Verrucomicrobiota bacterium]
MRDRRKWDVDFLIATVIPLLIVLVYALPCIIEKRTLGWYGAPPRTGGEAVRFGFSLIALALIVHAWYLPFYRRLPVLRWFLVVAGGLAFLVLGLLWDMWKLLCSR